MRESVESMAESPVAARDPTAARLRCIRKFLATRTIATSTTRQLRVLGFFDRQNPTYATIMPVRAVLFWSDNKHNGISGGVG